MATVINPPYPAFKDQLRSKTVRTAIQEIRDGHNQLVNEFNTAVSSTASEVTNARDNYTTLQENIQARRFLSGVLTGGDVTGSGTAKVAYTAGEGICGNGSGIEWIAGNSATIATATNRWDVLCINSDNSVSIVQGTDTATDVLPSISNTKRPIALIHVTDTAGPTIAQDDIYDAREQGTYLKNKWYFDPQDAIDAMSGTAGGDIYIGRGNYFQNLALLNKNNFSLKMSQSANMNSWDDSSTALSVANCNNFNIIGGTVKGVFNTSPSVGVVSSSNFYMDGLYFTAVSGSATYTDFKLLSCDNFKLNNFTYNDSINSVISTCSEYMEDGHHKDEIVFCGSATEKANMTKKGWDELTAANGRFIRVNNTAAGATGGVDSANLEHNHQWYADGGANNNLANLPAGDADGRSYNSSGVLADIIGKVGANDFDGVSGESSKAFTDKKLSTTYDNRPAYYELVALIHR